MRAWSTRVIEEAHLFNPAFSATLLAEAIDDYCDKAKHPLPFAVAFLILPIVLHEGTRKALPKSTLTALLPWVQDHRETLVGFPERVRQLQEITREAVLFGLQHEILELESGALRVGSLRKTVTSNRTPLYTDEVKECVERSGLRHSLGTLMNENGENVKTIQETLRHANFKVTMDVYTQGITAIRRSAHSRVVRQIMGTAEGEGNEE